MCFSQQLQCLPCKFLHPALSVSIMKLVFFIVVVGFELESLEIAEDVDFEQNVALKLLTPFDPLDVFIRFGTFSVTVEVNQELSTATLGSSQHQYTHNKSLTLHLLLVTFN